MISVLGRKKDHLFLCFQFFIHLKYKAAQRKKDRKEGGKEGRKAGREFKIGWGMTKLPYIYVYYIMGGQ